MKHSVLVAAAGPHTNKKFPHKLVARYKALKPLIDDLSTLLVHYIETYCTNAKDYHVVFDIDDTLIFDDNRQTPNIQIKHLLNLAHAHNCKVHLVTAREHSKEVLKWTQDELRRHNIVYTTLALAPKKERSGGMDRISAWKHAERTKHSPCIFSVGDQWGDSVQLRSEEDIDLLNQAYDIEEWPWCIIMPETKFPIYGIKIMAPA